MKFLRHLVALAMVIAVIIALAFLWKHSPMASVIANDRQGFRASGNLAASPLRDGAGSQPSSGLFNLNRGDDLAQTFAVLGLLFGSVVIVDRVRTNPRRAALGRLRNESRR